MDFHVLLHTVGCAVLFLFELHDGFGCGVVNIELFGHLRHKMESYIHDTAPVLNAEQQFGTNLFCYFFVFFGWGTMLDVDGLHVAADELYFGGETLGRTLCEEGSHFI